MSEEVWLALLCGRRLAKWVKIQSMRERSDQILYREVSHGTVRVSVKQIVYNLLSYMLAHNGNRVMNLGHQ